MNYNGLYVCIHSRLFLKANFNQIIGECGICFEHTRLLTLPCQHTLCLSCCKIIYFGIATTEKPIHWKEISTPEWIHDEDKLNEYEMFKLKWFDSDETYETSIKRRNKLCSQRPEWMNTPDFLNYENELLHYEKVVKEWKEYQKNKFKGNGKCPFCQYNRLQF
jgi:hypothetical protein